MVHSLLFVVSVLVTSLPGALCESCDDTGAIRLVNGTSPFEGRVDLCLNGEWGSVCQTGWSNDDAEVVCRQIAAEYGVDVYRAVNRGSFFFQQDLDDVPIHGTNFECLGTEEKLTECPYQSDGNFYCSHYSDAGVSCILTNSTLLPACAEELVNLTNMILPIACTNQSCLVDPSDYSTINRFECNGVTECGDCSDECHCQPNTYRRSQEACRVAGANMSSICVCNNKEFQCDNGFCVHNSWLCNGRDDCGDRSDEVLQMCIDRRDRFQQDVRDRNKHLIGLTLGVTFAVAASFVLFSLLILGLCMLSRCPMRKAYSYKPVIVPDPNVARAEEVEGGRVVRGGEGSGRGGRTRTPDQDPLMHDDEMKTADD